MTDSTESLLFNKTPQISILLPTFNGSSTIATAMESVRAQSCSEWELIIVNDGSTDNTGHVITEYAQRDPRIIIVHNAQNKGVQSSLNHALSLARGVYIARIDDDDVWIDPDKLQKQVNFFHQNPGTVLVGTSVQVVNENGENITSYIPMLTDRSLRRRMLGKNCFAHASVMFTKSVAQEVGGYLESPSVRHCEDYDLWLRMGTKGNLANISDYGLRYTLRVGSISHTHKKNQLSTNIRLIKKYGKYYPHFWGWYFFSWIRWIIFSSVGKILFSKKLRFLFRWYKQM